jgi:hypothetical protein
MQLFCQTGQMRCNGVVRRKAVGGWFVSLGGVWAPLKPAENSSGTSLFFFFSFCRVVVGGFRVSGDWSCVTSRGEEVSSGQPSAVVHLPSIHPHSACGSTQPLWSSLVLMSIKRGKGIRTLSVCIKAHEANYASDRLVKGH